MLQINIVQESLEQYNKQIDTIDFGNIDDVIINVQPLEYFIKHNQKAIFYIEITLREIGYREFIKTKIVDKLPIECVSFIKSDLGLLLIDYRTEGDVTSLYDLYDLIYLCNFYTFTRENVLFVTSNVLLNHITSDYFTIFAYHYFEESLWFLNRNTKIQEMKTHFTNFHFIDIKNHFLSFNRAPRSHRILLYTIIKAHPEINNIKISMGSYDKIGVDNKNINIESILTELGENYINTYNSLDFSKPIEIDVNIDNSMAGFVNMDLQRKTFCNIVTETLFEDNQLFLSEKTFKPIYCLQPFILVGNKNLINELHNMGYKTFDKWWDESYDSNNMVSKLKKIRDILIQLSKYTIDELEKIRNEMQDILVHNFKNLEERTNKNIFANYLYNTHLYTNSKKKIKLF
jgi:hypothetical protein